MLSTPDPIGVHPETPLGEAIKILAERRISSLPVVDQNGKLIGIISDSDLMWQETGVKPPPFITFLDSVIFLENPARYDQELHKALGQTVGEVMTQGGVVTVTPDRSIRDAAQLMHDRNVQRLPVLNAADQLIGILTRGDIIRFMAANQ
ncbi:MAG: CBS domain-containing protein [Leptolyngbyaceae cyanobacterium CRU_2_3]|nr:CBS domain-containing protein [Leptolyngbyaceae cyanobacterium CRU_2_3]